MTQIKSLDTLIKSLKNSDAEDYVKIVKDIDIPVSDFKKYCHWKEEGYSRNCIIKTDDFELILICWKENATTSIHGHDNQKCWIYQIDGEMTETRHHEDENGDLTECNHLTLTPGEICYMHDSMGYHSLENQTNKTAMTLHIYINPIDKCDVFNAENNYFEERILSYDTVDGEKV